MEDYQTTFSERHTDTEALCSAGRKIAAMHFGGITIECLLKAMIVASLPKGVSKEWKTDSFDPGHTITNPGHSYVEARKRHNRLNYRIQKFPEVRKWLEEIEHPNQHFIDIRYSCSEPDDESYKRWLESYQRLRKWLERQATQL
ncbi:MAG: hypothetical protein HC851_05870 [Acaryochloris sp. RU_4_1]|nr:hypothetical protein [Acaryochloris sp. SU_5_25]NJM65219.1 hypothetical protein [Acaryochloris sp. RU_4_1]NJR55601.1 hypothetical protein [Acaryochloris sp. CRU_2_0]